MLFFEQKFLKTPIYLIGVARKGTPAVGKLGGTVSTQLLTSQAAAYATHRLLWRPTLAREAGSPK